MNEKIIKEVLANMKVARFEAGSFHNLIKQKYGPYKNDDFEIDRVLYKKGKSEIIVKFVKISNNPNLKKLEKDMKSFAKKFGLRYNKTIKMKEIVNVIFERISLI